MTDGKRFDWAAVSAATNTSNALASVFERLSVPLTYVIVNRTQLSANAVTRIGGLFGLAGSGLFVLDQPLAAGLAYAAFFLLDCSDGAIARLRQTVSHKGADLDLWTDRIVLLTAVLAFSGVYVARGEGLAAWLCTAYLAAHYLTDLGWLMAVRLSAELPPQFDDLRAMLAAKQPVLPAPRRPWIVALGRFERAIRPSPWVCNIVFLLGICLAPGGQAVAVALGLLVWWIAIPQVKQRLANIGRRAK